MGHRKEVAATWRLGTKIKGAWWTVWSVVTNLVENTMACLPARAAKVSSRGASDETSITPADQTETARLTNITATSVNTAV